MLAGARAARLTALLLGVVSAWLALQPARARAEPRRVAVIVGANDAPPGRKRLRYAHDDARAVAQVLTDLGGFRPADVQVLADPAPNDVLAALDGALERNGEGELLLFFYYSGHADGGMLYPRGLPLSLASLRTRLSDPRAHVRVGLVDACRGGGFTGTKGMHETELFEVSVPDALDTEGSVLIASSSGLEDAHESELLRGSFFTHHWNAGLRGAADENGDTQVTLSEAFAYAKALTVRDTALYTTTQQHPSFMMNLRGRHDLSLSTVNRARASLTVTQRSGPIELVHLESGTVVLETAAGERSSMLAVLPGRYLVRRAHGKRVWALELAIGPGERKHVDEGNLSFVNKPGLASKGLELAEPRPLTRSSAPSDGGELTLRFGLDPLEPGPGWWLRGRRDVLLQLYSLKGLTDRLAWLVGTPTFVYRGGERGGLEWLPWGGLLTFGIGYDSAEGFRFETTLAAGLDVRQWLSRDSSIDLSFDAFSHVSNQPQIADHQVPVETSFSRRTSSDRFPTTWQTRFAVGYAHTVLDLVTFHIAGSFSLRPLVHGELTKFSSHSERTAMMVSFGTVQRMGLSEQPLVRIHFQDWVALNIDAALHYSLPDKRALGTLTTGVSLAF